MAMLKVSTLKERCDRLQKHLEVRKLITDHEKADLNEKKTRPRSRDDWWERYALLKSFARRLEWEKEKKASGDSPTALPGNTEDMKIRMLLAEPAEVMLDDGKRYKVYPKSYNALCMIVSVDYSISWLVEMANILAKDTKPESAAYLPRIAEQIGRLQNIMLDIVLHPGAGYKEESLENPAAYDFSPMDMMTIQNAHNEVNVVRMMALPVVTKKHDPKRHATSWSDFFVIMGMARKADPMALMKDEALSKLFAESHIRVENKIPLDEDKVA